MKPLTIKQFEKTPKKLGINLAEFSFNIFFMIILICGFALISCTKKIDCPGFVNEDLIPHIVKDNNHIIYKDDNNNELKIIIESIYKSEPYKFNCKDLNNICVCENYAEIVVKDANTDNYYPLIKIELNDKNNQEVFKYKFLDFSFEFDYANYIENIDYLENMHYKGDIQINSKFFKEVIVVNNTFNENSNVSSLYFNKEFGILKAITKNNLTYRIMP